MNGQHADRIAEWANWVVKVCGDEGREFVFLVRCGEANWDDIDLWFPAQSEWMQTSTQHGWQRNNYFIPNILWGNYGDESMLNDGTLVERIRHRIHQYLEKRNGPVTEA